MVRHRGDPRPRLHVQPGHDAPNDAPNYACDDGVEDPTPVVMVELLGGGQPAYDLFHAYGRDWPALPAR